MNKTRINITVLRHGLIEGNKVGRFCGVSDDPLSDDGREFIVGLMKDYSYPVPQKIYCSPALRCRETAEISFPGREYESVEGLGEFRFGRFENRLASELWEMPELFEGWKQQRPDFAFPGGETIMQCRNRGTGAFRHAIDEAADKGWSEIAIVTHSVLLSIVLRSMLTEVPEGRAALFCPNGMGLGLYVAPGESQNERPLRIYAPLPVGAARPDMGQSPYMKNR